MSGGGGSRRRARAVSAAAASSLPAPGPAGSRLGGRRTRIPAAGGGAAEAPFPSAGSSQLPRGAPWSSVSPHGSRVPGAPCGPPRRAGLWAPGGLRCAPRPQFPPSLPSCSHVPSCQQAGLRAVPGSPHFPRGARGFPSFLWRQAAPAPLPSSLRPLPEPPFVSLISRQACGSLQPLLRWVSPWALLFPLVPPIELSLPSALLCHLLPFQRHLCTFQLTPVLHGGFPLPDPPASTSRLSRVLPATLCGPRARMCSFSLWQGEDEVEL